jgi:hypothetical protein
MNRPVSSAPSTAANDYIFEELQQIHLARKTNPNGAGGWGTTTTTTLYTRALVTLRARRLLAIGALVAALGAIAVATYMARRPACEADSTAMKGEIRRDAGRRLLYFDGRCWTTTVQPPRDTPF